jgi:hypothetical protein
MTEETTVSTMVQPPKQIKFDPGIVPNWARREPEGVIYENGSLQYRFDGSDGNYYLGNEAIGDELIIRPFMFRWDKGLRWGRSAQSWLDVAFLNQLNTVSVISFKKAGATKIFEFLQSIVGGGVELCSQRVTLSTTVEYVKYVDQDIEDGDDFYFIPIVTNHEYVSEEEFADLEIFLRAGAFEWMLVGEVE